MRFHDDDVRWLLETLEQHGLEEIEVDDGDLRIRVRARDANAGQPVPAAAPVARQPVEPPLEPAPVHSGVPVIAPMAGIFYRQASPEADPFVDEGDRVEAGGVVGLVEVMKLFNEITAPVTGVVSKILFESEDRIEADDVLMYIQPASREE